MVQTRTGEETRNPESGREETAIGLSPSVSPDGSETLFPQTGAGRNSATDIRAELFGRQLRVQAGTERLSGGSTREGLLRGREYPGGNLDLEK
jgi:hypothetical protein